MPNQGNTGPDPGDTNTTVATQTGFSEVYGTPADGDVAVLNATTGRFEWGVAQALDADLTAIAAMNSATAGTIASDGAGWIKKTYAQFKTALALVKGDVGLGNVDNTADSAKPVSTAQQTALNLKANLASPALSGTPTAPTATPGTDTTQVATTAYADTALALKADLASPALTGSPTAPTQTANDNSTKLATTAYVDGSGTSSTPDMLYIHKTVASSPPGGTTVDWTGITPSVLTGTGIELAAGVVSIVEVGTYAITAYVDFLASDDGGGTWRHVNLADDNSPISGPNVSGVGNASTDTRMALPMTLHVTGDEVPDPIRLTVRHDQIGSIPVTVWLLIQRVA